MTFSELRELINKMDGLLANMAHQLGLNGIKAGTARLEVEAFMMYLSAADGKVDWEEAMALTEVCGEALNPDQITSVIRSQNIYTVEFERKIPMTLQILVFAENAYRKQGAQVTYSAAVIDFTDMSAWH